MAEEQYMLLDEPRSAIRGLKYLVMISPVARVLKLALHEFCRLEMKANKRAFWEMWVFIESAL